MTNYAQFRRRYVCCNVCKGQGCSDVLAGPVTHPRPAHARQVASGAALAPTDVGAAVALLCPWRGRVQAAEMLPPVPSQKEPSACGRPTGPQPEACPCGPQELQPRHGGNAVRPPGVLLGSSGGRGGRGRRRPGRTRRPARAPKPPACRLSRPSRCHPEAVGLLTRAVRVVYVAHTASYATRVISSTSGVPGVSGS